MKIIAIIVFVCALGLATATTEKWTQIRVKFAFSGILNNLDSFWKIQNTLNDTLAAKWVIVNSTNDLGLTTACITQADVRVCPLYDQKGFIAGMQLAIPPTDVEGKGIPYDFRNFTVFEKKLINGVEYWTSIYLVVNPVTLKSGGRTNMTTLGDGLWLKNGTSYTEVPTDEKTIATTTPYTKQNCLPNMGTHYYYNITNSTECAQFQPYFLLTKNGSINGLGWQFFGRTRPVTRNWYDSINRHAVQITVPLANACLADWTDKYGVISIRMYFVNNPWDINCDQKTESAVPITGFKGAVLDTLYLLSDIAASTKRMFFG